jgi:flagellar basal body rod protein FlgG
LTLNKFNELVNTQGDYVLDNQNQRIRLQDPNAPQNPNQRVPNLSMPLPQVMVNDLGQIYNNQDPNKTVLGRIKLVRYTEQPGGNDANTVLEIMKKYGYALPADNQLLQALDPNQVIDPQDPTSRRPRIIQGSLEDSNVSIVSEMIGLMMTSKDYDMSQKMISTQDKILDKSINELGRLQ